MLGFNVLSSDKTQPKHPSRIPHCNASGGRLGNRTSDYDYARNEHLMQKHLNTHKELEKVYNEVEKRKTDLEVGIAHLKEVQTRLANGDVRHPPRLRVVISGR